MYPPSLVPTFIHALIPVLSPPSLAAVYEKSDAQEYHNKTNNMAFSSISSAIVALAVGYLAYRYIPRPDGRKLPPGPKPHPLLGNARDFPPPGVPEHEHWLEHKDKYGPVSSVTVFGTTLVLIHDQDAAQEILERSAAKTSGRPEMVFANELCGYGSIAICQGYNDTFRRYRKLLHKELGTKGSAAKFAAVQEVEVGRQLVRALNEPAQWLEHLKTYVLGPWLLRLVLALKGSPEVTVD